MKELKAEVEALQIQGKPPDAIIRTLQRQGHDREAIEAFLDDAIGSAYRTHSDENRGRRLLGLGIFLPSALFNGYYLFFLDGGWAVSGLVFAVMIWGLLMMFLG